MNHLHQILKELIDIQDTEWTDFSAHLIKKEFKAKTEIIREGHTAKHLFFIASGLIRTYHLLNGKEISTYFACDHQFISTYSSFINQTPSFEILETIENSVVYAISYSSLTELYAASNKFERLGRFLAEKNYLCVLDRTYSMQTKTGKQKYLDFIASYEDKITNHIPQHQIASFLGMTPESLSRIRKEISTS